MKTTMEELELQNIMNRAAPGLYGGFFYLQGMASACLHLSDALYQGITVIHVYVRVNGYGDDGSIVCFS